MENSIQANLAQVVQRVDASLQASGRSRESITLVLATKTHTPEEIRTAVAAVQAAGFQVAVAENRAQEIAKHAELEDLLPQVPRHFIGHIQSNKARDIVRFASLIHSIDRQSAIDAVAKWCGNDQTTREVLLQVNTSGEESKGGYEPQVEVLREAIAACRNTGVLTVRGLMTIGANTTDESAIRDSLELLAQLRDELADPEITELSMGMSNDLEIAIAAGATMVRLGSAVFGPRNYQ